MSRALYGVPMSSFGASGALKDSSSPLSVTSSSSSGDSGAWLLTTRLSIISTRTVSISCDASGRANAADAIVGNIIAMAYFKGGILRMDLLAFISLLKFS